MSSIVLEFPAAVAADVAPRPVVREAARGQVRLTRRGRVVLVVVALLMALGVGVLLGGVSEATGEMGQDVPTKVVVVAEGDTLWGIAAEVADDGEVREAMREIQRLNALDTKVVQLGQKLRVPLAGK